VFPEICATAEALVNVQYVKKCEIALAISAGVEKKGISLFS
jgi:hypothetical protein